MGQTIDGMACQGKLIGFHRLSALTKGNFEHTLVPKLQQTKAGVDLPSKNMGT